MNFLAYLAGSNTRVTFLAMVRSPPLRPHVSFVCSHAHLRQKKKQPPPTDKPSGRNLLLPNHRSVGSNPPRSPRRNLAHFAYPKLTNARIRPKRSLVRSSQGSPGRLRERFERFRLGHLGVPKAGLRRQFGRNTEGHPSLPQPSSSYA